MVVKLPRARTLGVLLTLLALGLLPAHGVLHHHHGHHGAGHAELCGHQGQAPALGTLSLEETGPCTLCHQLASGVTLAGLSHLDGPDAGLTWLATESNVDRRDSLRTRACVRGPPAS